MPTKKRKLGSYPYGSVIFSIALSLFISGLFSIIVWYAQSFSAYIKDNIEISLYLKKNITKNEVNILRTKLNDQPFVSSTEKNPITFISKEETAKQFSNESNTNHDQLLGNNPFRDVLSIKISQDYFNTTQLRLLQTKLEQDPFIFEVDFPENIVETITRHFKKFTYIFTSIVIILLIITFLLINNAIKLALYSQRFLVRSMQLVGATPTFIKLPFLRNSFLYGFIAGLISGCGLFTLNHYAIKYLPNLEHLTMSNNYFIVLIASLGIFGGFIGVCCTLIAIQKYLKMSLDELY